MGQEPEQAFLQSRRTNGRHHEKMLNLTHHQMKTTTRCRLTAIGVAPRHENRQRALGGDVEKSECSRAGGERGERRGRGTDQRELPQKAAKPNHHAL